jgi:type III pantothenate kinase
VLLAIDVGNNQMALGLFEGDELRGEFRITTDRRKTHDEYGLLFTDLLAHRGFKASEVDGVVICSSVPPVVATLEWMCQKYFNRKPLVVGPGVKTGMVVRYDNPREVAADRIVTAVGAFDQYGGPLVVVDFGTTATILDVISASGEYLGGCIAPGVALSVEALFTQASMLPRIELVRPATALARNTVHAMQSGVIFGFAAQVDALIERIEEEMGGPVTVVATGDQAELLISEVERAIQVDPFLCLRGLRRIFDRNADLPAGRGSRHSLREERD